MALIVIRFAFSSLHFDQEAKSGGKLTRISPFPRFPPFFLSNLWHVALLREIADNAYIKRSTFYCLTWIAISVPIMDYYCERKKREKRSSTK